MLNVGHFASRRLNQHTGAATFGHGGGGIPPREAGGDAVRPLPCLNSNNCTEGEGQDHQKLQGNHRKTAFALAFNVRELCRKHGVERVGFLTLTFADHVICPKAAQRRFHSLKTHVLDVRYSSWIRVFERQKSGRIHYHLLVVLKDDIRTGADFEAFERGDYRTANPLLRAEWAFWRKTAKAYGFGRTELLPVKSTADGIGAYVGKYIAKHIEARPESDKGVRLVSFSRGAGAANSRFAWASPRSWLWRQKLAMVAERYGFRTFKHFETAVGKCWAHKLAGLIVSADLAERPEGVEYPTVAHAAADGRDVSNLPENAVCIRFEKAPGKPLEAPRSLPEPARVTLAGLIARAEEIEKERVLRELHAGEYVVQPPDPPYRPPGQTKWIAVLDAWGFLVRFDVVPRNEPF